jgi:predicted DNA-binding transcriptional regulator AlpA
MQIIRPGYLRYIDLLDLGIPFTRKHIRTLILRNHFPSPIRIGQNTLVWETREVDDWLAQRPRGPLAARGRAPEGMAEMQRGRRAALRHQAAKVRR